MNAPPLQFATSSDGVNIAFTECGSGPAWVQLPNLINHLSTQWTMPEFRKIYTSLAERWRLVMYDSRGQGSSSRGLSGTLTIDEYRRDLEAVVDRLNLASFVLSARLTFGQVAVSYAVEHPERVRALILSDYFDYQDNDFGLFGEMAATNWPLFINTMIRGYAGFDLVSVSQMVHSAVTQQDYLRQREAMSSPASSALLPKVTVPTAVLVERFESGGMNPTKEDTARRVAAQIRGARLLIHSSKEAGSDRSYAEEFASGLDGNTSAVGIRPERAGSSLSAREIEVLRLIVAGRSNQQIAHDLVISFNTVQRHVSHILSKTGLTNRTEAAVYAREHGLA